MELSSSLTVRLPQPSSFLRQWQASQPSESVIQNNEPRHTLVHIRVGGDGKILKADPEALKRSNYFSKYVPQSIFGLGRVTMIFPRRIDEDLVGMALAWLHGDEGSYTRMETHNLPDFFKFFELHWVEQYVIMHMFGIEQEANKLIERAVFVDPVYIAILRRHGMMKSPLGQLLLKLVAWNTRHDTKVEEAIGDCHFDRADFIDILRFTNEINVGDDAPVHSSVICKFHTHEQTTKCPPSMDSDSETIVIGR